MIGLDTNILVRHITKDDPSQSAAVDALMAGLSKERPAYVSHVVLVEAVWVLTRIYGMPRGATMQVMRALLGSRGVVIESPELVARALRQAARGADFADALIALKSSQAGCEHTVTLDRRAARLPGMRLLAH